MPTAVPAPRRRRRRWLLWSALLSTVLGLLLLAYGLTAATARPAWFQPRAIDHARLPEDKRALVRLLDDVGRALNEDRPVTVTIDPEQLDRWLAARAELLDLLAVDLGPVDHPVVLPQVDGRVRVAGEVPWGDMRVVPSALLRFEFDEEQVRVFAAEARLGNLRVPASRLLRHVPGYERAAAAFGPNAWVGPNDWIWPNGNRRFRITGLDISPARIDVSLEPLPR